MPHVGRCGDQAQPLNRVLGNPLHHADISFTSFFPSSLAFLLGQCLRLASDDHGNYFGSKVALKDKVALNLSSALPLLPPHRPWGGGHRGHPNSADPPKLLKALSASSQPCKVESGSTGQGSWYTGFLPGIHVFSRLTRVPSALESVNP